MKEMQDELMELLETARTWPKMKQGYEAGVEDNTTRGQHTKNQGDMGIH